MKSTKKLGFYFDGQKSNDWDWDRFLNGNVGMSGTDSQILLLINDIKHLYCTCLFINTDCKEADNLTTIKVEDLADAATQAKNQSIDLLIFANKADKYTKEGIIKLENLNQPYILWDHNGPGPDFEPILSQSNWLMRIVCVSKNHANYHRHKRYFNKVTYIYNGRDYKYFPKIRNSDKLNSINIGYLGAVGKSKGFHWVAKAWPRIKASFPNATLYVIGSVITHDKTKQTGSLGIAEPDFERQYIMPYLGNSLLDLESNGVLLTGHITPNEMFSLFNKLHLGIVNPNLDDCYETFCVSAIDFQAHQVPVIAGNKGGLKETVLNGETGLLINDSNDLSKVVISLLMNPKELYRLSQNCSNWVGEIFSRERVIFHWGNLIEDVLNFKDNKPIKLTRDNVNIKSIMQEMTRLKNLYIVDKH